MKRKSLAELKSFLDEKTTQYNQPGFIANDPISIPHHFSQKQDIEIAALFAATLAWGQRTTIIQNCNRLLDWMDRAPHAFMLHHRPKDLKKFSGFVHRTFNATDVLYFIHFLSDYYQKNESLESAFLVKPEEENVESGLIHFHNLFFSLPDFPARTKKHVATPVRKSACKRLNMFLRWMVRKDANGVDFGLWSSIRPAQLICPFDVHVARVARKLRLVTRKQSDWQAATELTTRLKQLDANDPVKYDFALFGLGVEEKF